MVFPLFQQHGPYLFLRLGEDHVDNHLLCLQKAVNPVDSLDKIVEFVVNAQKDRPVAVLLEVAAGAGQALFRGEQPCFPFGEGNHPSFPLLVVHAPVDVRHAGDLFQDGLPLIFQVVPQDKVGLRVAVYDFFCFGHPRFYALPLLSGRVLQVHRRVPHHLDLPVLVGGLSQLGVQDVLVHLQRRQGIAGVVVAQVRRAAQKQSPAAHPQPEFFLLVGVQRQVVGLGAVPLEEPGQGLPRVHNLQESGVMDQLLVPVGAGRGRGYQLVFDPPE